MDRLTIGDKIIDIEMSKLHDKTITPTITKIDRKQGKFVCNDIEYQKHYPHAFFRSGEGNTWKYFEHDKIPNCIHSLISLKACGVCRRCLANIAEIKRILKFYENKTKGKTQKDLDN